MQKKAEILKKISNYDNIIIQGQLKYYMFENRVNDNKEKGWMS